tara:strand:+ start:119 stop:523 length:405 start_codon:yes stop_codon:yes gene_type:complete
MYLDPKLAVAGIIPYKDKIVMVKRGVEPNIGKWSFPSGYVNRYETLENALKREVNEECGITIEVRWIVGIYSDKNNPVILAVFHANWKNGELKVNDDEVTDVDIFSLKQLPDLAFSHDKKIIKDWIDGLKLRNL